MFRHLSPKIANKDRREELARLKQTITGGVPIHFPQALPKKDSNERPMLAKERAAKNVDLQSNPKTNANSSANQPASNKRLELQKSSSKNGSVFDDYYQKKTKPQPKDKKQQISLSGDSYQSEGLNTLKKKQNSPHSIADKVGSQPHKNIVAVPITNQERGGYKSPGNRPQNKSNTEDEKAVKRILSFGGKKLMVGRFMQDGDTVSKKSGEAVVFNYPGSPKFQAKGKFQGLDVSDQKNMKETNKINTSNEIKSKELKSAKNIPKFIVNVKSSPYLLKKVALDSSNEISGERGIKKYEKMMNQHEKQKQREKEKEKCKDEEEKSLSFNRGEMFLSLKKRQEQHSLINKELNLLGVMLQLKLVCLEGDRSVKFTLIRKICESKKTCIFLAYHEAASFFFCLKRTSIAEMKKNVQEPIRQHKIQQHCSHPHLVKSFCSAYDSQHLYLVMEFMEGETLGKELKTELLKNMSEQSAAKARINQSVTTQISKINKVRKILFQIAGAVAYLHERAIVHRDIKPDNVFVSHETYKLGDFGSAAKVGSYEFVGTLDYAAPEILSQQPYDQKVDIWSLGCIAYELDVGRPPFFHINPEQTKRMALTGQYDKSLISDNELRSLIDKMLQVPKKQRLSSRQLLKSQFFQDLQQRNTFF